MRSAIRMMPAAPRETRARHAQRGRHASSRARAVASVNRRRSARRSTAAPVAAARATSACPARPTMRAGRVGRRAWIAQRWVASAPPSSASLGAPPPRAAVAAMAMSARWVRRASPVELAASPARTAQPGTSPASPRPADRGTGADSHGRHQRRLHGDELRGTAPWRRPTPRWPVRQPPASLAASPAIGAARRGRAGRGRRRLAARQSARRRAPRAP